MCRPKIETTLDFCIVQAASVSAGPDAWRWLTLGLSLALHESLIIALTSYDTAKLEDVCVPGQDSVASLHTLLRRAQSGAYLCPPEKLALPKKVITGALALQDARNLFMHRLPGDRAPDIAALAGQMRNALQIIDYLLVDYPAHDDKALTRCVEERLQRLEGLIVQA